MSSPRFDHYDWAGGREAMLHFGPAEGAPVVIAALPLFEEANRTRTFAVALLRALAARGIAGVLPDLPGQGESMVPLEAVSLADMRAAHAAAAGRFAQPVYRASLRSGALLESGAVGTECYHFAPQDGASLFKELSKMRRLRRENSGIVEIAGNLVAAGLLAEIDVAELPAASRTVRLATDPLPADRKIDAAPLWRRAEPGSDPALVSLLCDDIAEWIARCEA